VLIVQRIKVLIITLITFRKGNKHFKQLIQIIKINFKNYGFLGYIFNRSKKKIKI